MTRDWLVGMIVLALTFSLTACRPRPAGDAHGPGDDRAEHDEHDEHAGEKSEEHDGTDALDSAGRVPLAGVTGIAFAPVGLPVEEGVWYPGEAMAAEDERAMLTSPVAGVVTSIEVFAGREVPAGTPLLTVRSPELAALTATLLTSRAAKAQAEGELRREERLAAANAGAARELDAARTALAVAEAEETAARLALEARGLSVDQAGASVQIRAPRGGRVASFDVLIGEGVEGGQRLGTFESARASLVRIELPLPGPPAWVPGVATTVRRGDGKSWAARVEGVPASLTAATRRLTFRLRIDGEDRPYPGTPLEVRVPLPAGIVVPQDAVQQIEGEWGVFVVEGDEARFQPIRRGPELGGDVIVLEGLDPSQQIATEGAYLLKALALKRSGGGEAHAH